MYGKGKFMAKALLTARDYERIPSPNRISASVDGTPWLKATPNPATNWLQLETDGRKLMDVRIYDLSGRMVLQTNTCGSMEQCNLSLPESMSGWHILEGTDADGENTRISIIINP
jgi:hypothetical protein